MNTIFRGDPRPEAGSDTQPPTGENNDWLDPAGGIKPGIANRSRA